MKHLKTLPTGVRTYQVGNEIKVLAKGELTRKERLAKLWRSFKIELAKCGRAAAYAINH